MWDVHPIISAMRRNQVGAVLIAAQIALTLAILCNALFIIQQRVALSGRSSGVDEADLFAIYNQWVGEPSDLSSLLHTDLATLRSLPGVVDAYATNSYPLTNIGSSAALMLRPHQTHPTARAALYYGDQRALHTLGLQLLAGRDFTSADVIERSAFDDPAPVGLIVTRALAQQLFPNGNALGQRVYVMSHSHTIPIIGIVARLQVPWSSAASGGSTFDDNSVLMPYLYVAQYSHYLVRAQPGRLAALMKAAPQALFEVNRARVIRQLQSFSEARAEVYRDQRGLAIILAAVCMALLAVTAFGIVGLTSYWVSQRRRHIGIRRAVGATRLDIVRYFLFENLLIVTTGALAGLALAVGINLWMVSRFEMARMPLDYCIAGSILVLLLGQCAALRPAIRAASVPPAVATRSV